MVPVVGAYWAAEVQPDLHAASVLEDWLTLLEKTEEDTIDGKDYYSEGLSEILGEPEGIYYSAAFDASCMPAGVVVVVRASSET